MRLFRILFFFVILCASSRIFATDGTLGTTSTGTVTVSITIPSLVQVSGLGNLALGSATSFPVTTSTTGCIYSNVSSPSGSYYVTVSSANASSGAFRVKNSGTDYIVYSAFWNNTSSPLQTTSLTSGTKTAQQTGGSATRLDCGGSPNANFNVSFSASQVQGAPAAAYSDTVTLVISPT